MKTIPPALLLYRLHSLYPTFKEWKQIFSFSSNLPVMYRLYPTFKEWKPSFFKIVKLSATGVYILPLRNENFPPPRSRV